MLGFGRKKKEEEVEKKPKKLDPRSRRKLDEEIDDLKDLKSKNKNKRKEPPKPWGKSERLLVMGLALGTAGIAAVLGLSSRSWKMPGLPRLITSEFNLEKTYVLEADEKNDPATSRTKQLFIDETKNLSGVYGFYVGRLFKDESYGLLENELFPAGTLMRLPVMISMYIEAEEGNLLLSSKKDLIERMGKNDTGAYEEALSVIGAERVQQIIKEIGMSNTSINNNTTTPADMGKLLKKLWDRRLLNETNTQEVLEILTKTESTETRDVHVLGEDVHAVSDAGIVFSNLQPLVIVLMSKGVVESEASSVFPILSGTIYNAEN